MRTSTVAAVSFLSVLGSVNGQAVDGKIVPFSTFPACAALCGPLYDVQGKCAPDGGSVDNSCFCSDSRLKPFEQDGTAGVSSVCGAASCSATADLQSIKTWYTSFCAKNGGVTATTTSSGTAATKTSSSTSSGSNGTGNGSSSNTNSTWMSTHWKWVVMLAVMIVVIVGSWVAACLFRKRYLRRKEREIEMLPPVALGPHQLQAMTGGYRYGDGVVDANRAAQNHAGGHHKEMASVEATMANGAPRYSKGLTKKRG